MKEFIQKMQNDKAFAKEFMVYMSNENDKVKEINRQVAKQLDKIVMDAISSFADSKGMTLTVDAEVSETLNNMSRQLCRKLDALILDQFRNMNITNDSTE